MHGHLLWVELDLSPNFSTREAGQWPGSGNAAGKGKEGAAWHRKAVCVAMCLQSSAPGETVAHSVNAQLLKS